MQYINLLFHVLNIFFYLILDVSQYFRSEKELLHEQSWALLSLLHQQNLHVNSLKELTAGKWLAEISNNNLQMWTRKIDIKEKKIQSKWATPALDLHWDMELEKQTFD